MATPSTAWQPAAISRTRVDAYPPAAPQPPTPSSSPSSRPSAATVVVVNNYIINKGNMSASKCHGVDVCTATDRAGRKWKSENRVGLHRCNDDADDDAV
ncbi:electron transfer flavoprotein [Anopheles sinensis]|uniref:Electron transfer flavoprotein n=1 Tax=Anopheles sinensis TaxID=74873 RepID=A0A084WD01_ANOSI|nr:electron transfer flavoprotein [Anopheles sinensis]